jgi:hypothetical protein
VLLATVAQAKLALGEPTAALAAAVEAVAIMEARGLGACALRAPIALTHVLTATRGPAARERVDRVLARALGVARDSGARVFEPHIHRELAALARVRGDDVEAERRQAEAQRSSRRCGLRQTSAAIARRSTAPARIPDPPQIAARIGHRPPRSLALGSEPEDRHGEGEAEGEQERPREAGGAKPGGSDRSPAGSD